MEQKKITNFFNQERTPYFNDGFSLEDSDAAYERFRAQTDFEFRYGVTKLIADRLYFNLKSSIGKHPSTLFLALAFLQHGPKWDDVQEVFPNRLDFDWEDKSSLYSEVTTLFKSWRISVRVSQTFI